MELMREKLSWSTYFDYDSSVQFNMHCLFMQIKGNDSIEIEVRKLTVAAVVELSEGMERT